MYAANLPQVFSVNPKGRPFKCWVILISQTSYNEKDTYLRNQHRELDITLTKQNVNFTEITTTTGKLYAYKKFNIQNSRHPIFLVTNRYPDDFSRNEKLLIIEWGKWEHNERFKEDVMAFTFMFNDEDFLEIVNNAYDRRSWDNVIRFIRQNRTSIINIGISIIKAVI